MQQDEGRVELGALGVLERERASDRLSGCERRTVAMRGGWGDTSES